MSSHFLTNDGTDANYNQLRMNYSGSFAPFQDGTYGNANAEGQKSIMDFYRNSGNDYSAYGAKKFGIQQPYMGGFPEVDPGQLPSFSIPGTEQDTPGTGYLDFLKTGEGLNAALGTTASLLKAGTGIFQTRIGREQLNKVNEFNERDWQRKKAISDKRIARHDAARAAWRG